MQIYELTRDPQLDEGLWDNVKSVAKTAVQIGQEKINKTFGTNLGGTATGGRASSSTADVAAWAIARPRAKLLGKAQNDSWLEGLPASMQNEKVTALQKLDPPTLEANLDYIITRLVSGNSSRVPWDDSVLKIDKKAYGGTGAAKAQDAVNKMQSKIDELVGIIGKAPAGVTNNISNATLKVWEQIAYIALVMQNMIAFHDEKAAVARDKLRNRTTPPGPPGQPGLPPGRPKP